MFLVTIREILSSDNAPLFRLERARLLETLDALSLDWRPRLGASGDSRFRARSAVVPVIC